MIEHNIMDKHTILRSLSKQHPGISKVERNENGYIVLNPDSPDSVSL
jgi:hypothetical protein